MANSPSVLIVSVILLFFSDTGCLIAILFYFYYVNGVYFFVTLTNPFTVRCFSDLS